MRLHGYWRSSSTWRVRIALDLKGLAYETVPVNLLAGDQRQAAYLGINPLGQVPALEVEEQGTVRRLAQSMAICDYLDRRWPTPPLLPADPYARARALQLAEIVNSGIQPLQNNLVVRRLDELAPGQPGRAWAREWIERGLAALEAEARTTAGRQLIGDAISLADVFLVPQLHNARRFAVALEPFPTLLRVERACLEHPAFTRSHPDQQPDAPRPEEQPCDEPERGSRQPGARQTPSDLLPRAEARRGATMTHIEPLGIRRLEAIHHYVHDLERSRRFYTEKLGFDQIAESGPELEERGHQRSLVFQAGECTVMCSTPHGQGGRAARWLRKHPDGVGTLVFEVEDVERAFRLLDGRGGTPIHEVRWFEEGGGRLGTFSITTPFGGATFRFVERHDFPALLPGLIHHPPRGRGNPVGFTSFDHVTSNFETMAPALLWLEHVIGCQRYWDIQFHTEDVTAGGATGSGLRSIVMHEPVSGLKFASNEPLRPFFRSSQINLFHEDQRGDGVQHVALGVRDIIPAVRGLRQAQVGFYPTSGSYYDRLPARLDAIGVRRIDEDLATLRQLEILVDGSAEHQYLLQIFLLDSATTHGEPEAGPFFYEIIQRKGDRGFGGGNFRALFESIEAQQRAEGRV